MDDLIGQTISGFRIDGQLGQGGMGSVYLATDITLERQVAIKMMLPQLANRDDFRQRFLQEARAIVRIHHPNIVNVLQFQYLDEQLFLVMEYVPGGSLREYLKHLIAEEKQIELAEALELTIQIAGALQEAHAQGVYHCDIKPENILLKPETSKAGEPRFRAMLTDFGLARLEGGMIPASNEQAMGTFPYMSPEQCRSERLDARSDIYALGILLFELVTTRRPFNPHSFVDAREMHTKMKVPSLAGFRAGLPLELERAIVKTMAKDPNDRFQSAQAFINELEKLKDDLDQGQVTVIEEIAAPTDSLTTYIQELPLAPLPPAPDQTDKTRVVITPEGQAPRTVPLDKEVMIIGREKGKDIVLEERLVSREHARIERMSDGMYRITDLDSANGTFLDDTRLTPNVAQHWKPGQTVRICNFRLDLQLGDKEAGKASEAGAIDDTDETRVMKPVVVEPPKPAPVPEPEPIPASAVSQVVSSLKQIEVSLDPGSQRQVVIPLLNTSIIVDHFTSRVVGLPPEWVMLPSQPMKLLPKDSGEVIIAFHPPMSPKSTAKQHSFEVRIKGVNTPDGQELVIPGSLVITPFYGFSASELTPARLNTLKETEVTITNTGNSSVTFTLSASDREQALHFRPEGEQISDWAGAEREAAASGDAEKTWLVRRGAVLPV